MNIVNFNLLESTPHPDFKGVRLFPILTEGANLGIRSNFALISPNCEISPHTHTVVEVFTIVTGSPSVLVNGEWTIVSPGTTIIALPGELHGVKNTTTADVMLQANFNIIKEE
jgi:quercetin dioxygenase-like cupin family protein